MSSASRPARSLGSVRRLDLDALGGHPRLRRGDLTGRDGATAERQAGEGLRYAQLLSLVRVRKSRASTPIAQESSAPVARLPRRRSTYSAPLLRSCAAVSAPDSAYAASERRPRQTTRWPACAATRPSALRGTGDVDATPPASRLLAKVARAVCWAIGPSVARKTWAAGGASRSASKLAP